MTTLKAPRTVRFFGVLRSRCWAYFEPAGEAIVSAPDENKFYRTHPNEAVSLGFLAKTMMRQRTTSAKAEKLVLLEEGTSDRMVRCSVKNALTINIGRLSALELPNTTKS